MMRLILPYPARALWPNARSHWAIKARETKKARACAWGAAKACPGIALGNGPIPVTITLRPKATGPVPDADNIVAAAKAYLDGAAQAIGVNDKHFAAPTVRIDDQRTGQMIVEVGR